MKLLTDQPSAGSRHLYEVMLLLRVGSGICERQHLLGQALKRSKSRGVARDGYRLAQHTYRASVVGEGKRISDKLHQQVFARMGVARQQFSKLARTFRLGYSRGPIGKESTDRRKRVIKLNTMMNGTKRKSHIKSPYQEFMRQEYQCNQPFGSPEAAAERARLIARWGIKSEAEKALYASDAAAATELSRNAFDTDVASYVEMEQATSGLSVRDAMKKKRAFAHAVIGAVNRSPIWARATRVSSASSGLHPRHVLPGTEAIFRASCKVAFDYDTKIVENPPGVQKPMRSCAQVTGGNCRDDIKGAKSSTATSNIYRVLTRCGYKRSSYPIVVSLSCDGVGSSATGLVGDTIGVGEMLLIACLRPDTFDANGLVWSAHGHEVSQCCHV